jgi:hypothetical protein
MTAALRGSDAKPLPSAPAPSWLDRIFGAERRGDPAPVTSRTGASSGSRDWRWQDDMVSRRRDP